MGNTTALPIVPVVLCGGSGTRLWPLSRQHYPKQFLQLVDDRSLLQNTVLRLAEDYADPIVVTGESHRFLTAEQLREVDVTPASLIIEPEPKNTAPAIAAAAIEAERLFGKEALLLVLPADHVIETAAQLQQAVTVAAGLAADDYLVTFGIEPTQAATGYGYIQRGEPIRDHVFSIQQFVEKPDAERAQAYVDAGGYSWNSGMFLFKASVYLAALQSFEPDMANAVQQAVTAGQRDLDFFRLDATAFSNCKDDSIDYAVMERTERAAVLPVDFGWSDVGSWASVAEVRDKDDNGNTLIGDVAASDARNNLVLSDSRLVTLLGVQDMVVIDTADALLVADKAAAENIKQIVGELKQQQRSEVTSHRKVYRPWGSYESIDMGPRFQVKHIVVKPGSKLSLQMHHHRAEHWIIVKGTARVTRGEDSFILSEDQSTYIELGQLHRLENPGRVDLELIEVQTGSYLGEDDIERFEDDYGR